MSSKDEGIQRLQMLEQNMQAVSMQKQQFQAQLYEVEGALKELSSSSNAFKIVGGIMISTDKDSLSKELESKKELLEVRVQALEKQEKQLKERAKSLQEEVLAGKE